MLHLSFAHVYLIPRHLVPDERFVKDNAWGDAVQQQLNLYQVRSLICAGMGELGMMMMMQMYFTATTHVTLWFQRWHTNSSAWCHSPTLFISYQTNLHQLDQL